MRKACGLESPPSEQEKARCARTEYRPIADLKPNPDSPRQHNRHQVRKVAKSIDRFGFSVPVLVDRNGTIIAGHCRIDAAKSLGMVEVPTICLDHLTEAEAKAFMIADNRLAEIASWDDKRLGKLFKDLSELHLEIDLEDTGFDMGQIDLLIEGIDGAIDEGGDAEDELPSPKGPPVSKVGDLWLLRDHRLFCGNSLEDVSYLALMDGKRAAVGFHDPPYNVRIDGHASGLGATLHREFPMASGEMSESDYIAFLTQALSLISRYTVAGAITFVCQDWRHIRELIEAARATKGSVQNLCVWAKDSGGMGSLYRSQHELVLVLKYGRGSHRNNVQLGRNGRNRTNVWSYPGMNSTGRTSDEGNLLKLHPTVKPVRLVADAILDVSARNDIVMDSFLGSGSTLIAAERTGRRCYGMELDPLYVDTAIRRWQAYTGERAKDAVTGRYFDEMVDDAEATDAA